MDGYWPLLATENTRAWTARTGMALALRLTVAGGPVDEAEDIFGDALGVIFEDDTMNLRR